LYLADADGTHLRLLRGLPVGDIAWSPDGRWIAHNDVSLQIISLENGQNINVVKEVVGQFSGSLSWAPDGQHLAVVIDPSFMTTGDADVAIVTINGTVPPAPVRLPGDQYDTAWLPDGRLVVLDAGGVWTVRPDGTDLRPVYQGALSRGRVTPSPDGRHVVITQWDNQASSAFLVDVDAVGGDRRPACGGSAVPGTALPRWSPAADRLLCPVTRNGRTATVVAPAAGGPATVVDPSLADPDWSADGRLVVGTDSPSGPYRDIAVMASDGTGRHTVLTAATDTVTTPRWSPDDRRIAFTLR
jgi:Tol biopolymer transport system component